MMVAVDISPLKDGGVLKEILKEGNGDELPSTGSAVTVHYTGTLLDGTKFDSSKDHGRPFTFDLGLGHVIKGWDIGIATMKKGEVAMLTCAPDYAYGKKGSGAKIPGDATLKFEVQMIDFLGEDLSPNKDGGIQRFPFDDMSRKKATHPSDGSIVDVHLIGRYNDVIFEERDVQFPLGEGEDVGVVAGVEIALEKFSKGETSRLKLKSKYAFKDKGNSEFNIPPDADVTYIVQLNNFERTALPSSLKPKERIEQAKLYKDKAANYFKSGKFGLARKIGEKSVSYLEPDSEIEDDLKTEWDSLSLTSSLNLALYYLKNDLNAEAKAECDDVLALYPENEKALFRRGQAQLGLASPEAAIEDFEAVLKVSPKNAAAAKQLAVCNSIVKQNLARERKLYANMFNKFAEADKQKEEEEMRQQPDVMRGTLGEWGQEERPGGRDATAFEKENPNILMLNANGTDEFKNM